MLLDDNDLASYIPQYGDHTFNLYITDTGGVFANTSACFSNSCGNTGTAPTVTVTPIVTKQDSTVTVCMPITDPDLFSTFTASVCGAAKHGTAAPSVLNGQLCVNYVPTARFFGADSVCIRVCDNTNKCSEITIPITVTATPTPPMVTVTPIVTKQDSTVTKCYPITSYNPNATFTASLCSQPLHGTAAPSVSNGQLCVTYSPTVNYAGTDTVCIVLCDNNSLCSTIKIPVTVNTRPHAPTVTATPILTKQDSTVTVCTTITDLDANSTFTGRRCA